MNADQPEQAIRDELRRILSSAGFARNERLSRFLNELNQEISPPKDAAPQAAGPGDEPKPTRSRSGRPRRVRSR